MITTIICTPARKLMAAALALTGCRVLSEWDSILAGSVAVVVIFVLVASLIAGMPRLRRMSIVIALPVATVANSVVFALGGFIVLLGAKGYLPNGTIAGGHGPLWNWDFTVVPLVAATNCVALAWPSLAARWRLGVWLANMASAAYAIRFWDVEDDYSRMLGIPMSFESILLVALAVLSLAVTTWDAREGLSLAAPRRRKWAIRSGCLIVGLLWLSLWPVYAKRQIAYSLKSYGLWANFGIAFPGWTPPFELPFQWYDYLGEVTGAAAPEGLTGDAVEAGRVLNTLPWLGVVAVHELPLDGGRILKPLAGHKRLSQIALKGAGATDETLADAARLPALNSAVFEAARISDEGLVHLADAPWLQRLAIRRTPISGDGLRHLKSLPRLADLDLSGTNLGDQQAALLTKFKTLTKLSLNDTKLSDEGLASLRQCKGLRLLEIGETRVTVGGVERLRRALPGCNVVSCQR